MKFLCRARAEQFCQWLIVVGWNTGLGNEAGCPIRHRLFSFLSRSPRSLSLSSPQSRKFLKLRFYVLLPINSTVLVSFHRILNRRQNNVLGGSTDKPRTVPRRYAAKNRCWQIPVRVGLGSWPNRNILNTTYQTVQTVIITSRPQDVQTG